MTASSSVEPRSALSRQPHSAQAGGASAGEPTKTVQAAAEPAYSIRMAENAGEPCSSCDAVTGSGPVGYHGDRAICDLCLLERSTDLGLMLATIAVVRAYAGTGGTPEQQGEALNELGAFARIYHRIASKSWPARIFRIPGFTDRNDATH